MKEIKLRKAKTSNQDDKPNSNGSAAQQNPLTDDNASSGTKTFQVPVVQPVSTFDDSSDSQADSSSKSPADQTDKSLNTVAANPQPFQPQDSVTSNSGAPPITPPMNPPMSSPMNPPMNTGMPMGGGFGGYGSGDPWGGGGNWGDPWGNSGGNSQKKKLTPQERTEMVEKVYQAVLGRKADTRDINYYKYSSLGEEEITRQLLEGKEHQQLVKDGREYKSVITRSESAETRVKVLEAQIQDQLKEFKELTNLLREKNQHIQRLRSETNNPYDFQNNRQRLALEQSTEGHYMSTDSKNSIEQPLEDATTAGSTNSANPPPGGGNSENQSIFTAPAGQSFTGNLRPPTPKETTPIERLIEKIKEFISI